MLSAFRAAPGVSNFAREAFCVMLSPFAPHLAEEIWSGALKKTPSVAGAKWPEYDEGLCVEDVVQIAVQVNGKLRDRVTVARDSDEEAVKTAALNAEKVLPHIEGKTLVKFIYIPNRLANVIVS